MVWSEESDAIHPPLDIWVGKLLTNTLKYIDTAVLKKIHKKYKIKSKY